MDHPTPAAVDAERALLVRGPLPKDVEIDPHHKEEKNVENSNQGNNPTPPHQNAGEVSAEIERRWRGEQPGAWTRAAEYRVVRVRR